MVLLPIYPNFLIAPECRNCSCSCGCHDGVLVQILCVVWGVGVWKKLTRVLFAGFVKGLCIFEIRQDAFLKSKIVWISTRILRAAPKYAIRAA